MGPLFLSFLPKPKKKTVRLFSGPKIEVCCFASLVSLTHGFDEWISCLRLRKKSIPTGIRRGNRSPAAPPLSPSLSRLWIIRGPTHSLMLSNGLLTRRDIIMYGVLKKAFV